MPCDSLLIFQPPSCSISLSATWSTFKPTVQQSGTLLYKHGAPTCADMCICACGSGGPISETLPDAISLPARRPSREYTTNRSRKKTRVVAQRMYHMHPFWLNVEQIGKIAHDLEESGTHAVRMYALVTSHAAQPRVMQHRFRNLSCGTVCAQLGSKRRTQQQKTEDMKPEGWGIVYIHPKREEPTEGLIVAGAERCCCHLPFLKLPAAQPVWG